MNESEAASATRNRSQRRLSFVALIDRLSRTLAARTRAAMRIRTRACVPPTPKALGARSHPRQRFVSDY